MKTYFANGFIITANLEGSGIVRQNFGQLNYLTLINFLNSMFKLAIISRSNEIPKREL